MTSSAGGHTVNTASEGGQSAGDVGLDSPLKAVEVSTAPSSVPYSDQTRDRIVILGRRRAGKTIFLARLYEQLWNSSGLLHMRALSGDSHMACMDVIEELRAGRWPASTLGARYTDIEISFNGSKRLLVALDYPGEVFRQAFVENVDTEDTRVLIDHVDRAAAVLVLLDPSIADSASTSEVVDDDYGMVQAIHRIREGPGGENVPIVFVLTKCDVNKYLLRDQGGLRSFVATHYANLLRAVGRFKVYACAAVRAIPTADGEQTASLEKPPIGVIEPLQYCLEQMAEQERVQRENEQLHEQASRLKRHVALEYIAHRRAILFWSIFWSAAIVLIGGVAIVTWILTHRTE